ncbi:MAG: GNAT family N-acetyltransferase [Anaerolineales bacterium]|nr:GNAT family N-acetyltransferase [Anaerolineales bacterium]
MVDFEHNSIPLAQTVANTIAAQFIAQATPVRFTVAQSSAEREAAYRLRYEVVTTRGWADAEKFPGELEQDVYDAEAVHLLGWKGHKLVATTRLVFPSAGKLLPTEVEFGLRVEPQGQVVDGGRAIIARSCSDYQHRIFAGLLGYTWFEIQSRGFRYLCGAAVPAMIRLCQSIGYHITVLGHARPYWGQKRYPIRFDVLESVPMLFKRWGHTLENQANNETAEPSGLQLSRGHHKKSGGGTHEHS